MIAVKTQRQRIDYIDPFQGYLKLRDYLGQENLYLLESMSGPEKDKKNSMIGFGPLFKIEVFKKPTHSIIKISGKDAVVKAMRNHFSNLKFLQELTENQYQLNQEQKLWQLLRHIQALFIIDETQFQATETFNFGFFGYFGYDTAWYAENLPYEIGNESGLPDICLMIYQGHLSIDLENKSTDLILHHSSGFFPTKNAKDLIKSLQGKEILPEVQSVPRATRIKDSTNKVHFLNDVKKTLNYISIGDIYQVQLGHSITISSEAEPLVVYERLRQRNPSPFMYLAPFDFCTVVGTSPELFAKIEGSKVTLRPIAGTIKRSKDEEENEKAKQTLKNDEKEIAEHVMLVDLCRNDIGRICQRDSLQVDELMVVEQYSHLYHLVSNVSGDKLPGMDVYDVIAATFPEGTMTGAPKIRAMEIIEEIETSRRGIYAGSIGLIDFSGYSNLALCIRSTVHKPGQYEIRASAGIVAESIPEKEWRETLIKMSAVYWAITNEELSHEHLGD